MSRPEPEADHRIVRGGMELVFTATILFVLRLFSSGEFAVRKATGDLIEKQLRMGGWRKRPRRRAALLQFAHLRRRYCRASIEIDIVPAVLLDEQAATIIGRQRREGFRILP